MEFIKATILGGVLTGVVSLVIGSQGSAGGQLAIHMIRTTQYDFYWSWPLFLAGTGLSWGIMMLQR